MSQPIDTSIEASTQDLSSLTLDEKHDALTAWYIENEDDGLLQAPLAVAEAIIESTHIRKWGYVVIRCSSYASSDKFDAWLDIFKKTVRHDLAKDNALILWDFFELTVVQDEKLEGLEIWNSPAVFYEWLATHGDADFGAPMPKHRLETSRWAFYVYVNDEILSTFVDSTAPGTQKKNIYYLCEPDRTVKIAENLKRLWERKAAGETEFGRTELEFMNLDHDDMKLGWKKFAMRFFVMDYGFACYDGDLEGWKHMLANRGKNRGIYSYEGYDDPSWHSEDDPDWYP